MEDQRRTNDHDLTVEDDHLCVHFSKLSDGPRVAMMRLAVELAGPKYRLPPILQVYKYNNQRFRICAMSFNHPHRTPILCIYWWDWSKILR